MVSADEFRKLAKALPGVEELPHFHMTSFRVKKKIFATMDENLNRCTLMLNQVDQSVFCDMGAGAVEPVPNKWGQKGATYFYLNRADPNMVKDALKQAYHEKT